MFAVLQRFLQVALPVVSLGQRDHGPAHPLSVVRPAAELQTGASVFQRCWKITLPHSDERENQIGDFCFPAVADLTKDFGSLLKARNRLLVTTHPVIGN